MTTSEIVNIHSLLGTLRKKVNSEIEVLINTSNNEEESRSMERISALVYVIKFLNKQIKMNLNSTFSEQPTGIT